MTKDDFLTIAETAHILRCSEKTIKRYLQDRVLLGSYIAEKWLVSKDSVIRLLNDQANTMRRPFSE